MTRGIYRADGPIGTGQSAVPDRRQGYRFAAGHRLKVEVTANDAPYHQASSTPAIVTVDRLAITLPLLGQPAPEDAASPTPVAESPAGRMLRWWFGAAGLLVVVTAGVAATYLRRRARFRAGEGDGAS